MLALAPNSAYNCCFFGIRGVVLFDSKAQLHGGAVEKKRAKDTAWTSLDK